MFKLPKRMPLQLKIMLLTISVVFLTLLTAGILVIKNVAEDEQADISKRALDIGRMVATVPAVQRAILSDNPSAVLQPFAERWRVATGAAFIVIANMDQIRLSHPITANVGTPMADLYREPVLHGQEYVYVGKGSLAPSLRANVPIYAPDDPARQIGFVSVGFYLDDLNKTIAAGTKQVLYALLIALAFSVGGAVYVARDVKKAIFGLEPHEIAALLRERTATLEAIREGVVAVDKQGCIRMLNSEAAKLLGLRPDEAVGRPIDAVLPENRLGQVIQTGQAVYDQEQRVGDIIIFANSVPIVVDGEVTGVVISFRDRTEVYRLAEEITGVHRFVEVMRAQAHEYKNKLHAIGGLVQLGRYEQAVDFITENSSPHQGLFDQLRGTVKETVTFALLLGKSSRARELGAELTVTPDSALTALPRHFSGGDMVLVLGNLIENALEAVRAAPVRQVTVRLSETAEGLTIAVRNSGPWIDDALGSRIYQRGVTTKGSGRGYGLALVAEKVKVSGGSVSHRNLPEGGVEFTVFIPNR
ncbi:ATP-binding protein [Sporolituus thermophilus]